jgi:hypothetical protein
MLVKNRSHTYYIELVLLIIIFMSSVYGYSLDGTWAINPTYLKNSPSNKTTIVDFEKVISNDNTTIEYTMTIFSCLTLQYTYEVNDNDIYLTYKNTTSSILSYSCSNNQIN